MDEFGALQEGKIAESAQKHDRAVLTKEILAFANGKCRSCHGRGILNYVVSSDRGPVRKDIVQVIEERMCGCAVRRFHKANQNNTVMEEGALYWVKNAPPLADKNLPSLADKNVPALPPPTKEANEKP